MIRKFSISLVLLGFLVGVLFSQNILNSYSVKDSPDGLIIELEFSAGVPQFKHFTLSNPPRIVIDLVDVTYNLSEKLIVVGKGGVERIRGAQFQKTPVYIARVVLDVDGFRRYQISEEDGKLKVLIGAIGQDAYSKSEGEGVNTAISSKTRTSEKQSEPKLEVGERYFYSSRGKKDPFQPETEIGEEELLNVSEAKLLGVIKSEEGNVALLQDRRGVGYVLKEGDRVRNGRVVRIESDRVIFATVDFGFTRRIELKLEEEKK